MSIFKPIKDEFVKRFKQFYHLGRYGEKPRPKDEVWESHKSLAESVFNSSCIILNENGSMYPTFFVVKEEQFMPLILSPESFDDVSLESYASMAINVADEENAEAIMFISEQWMVKVEANSVDLKDFQQGKKRASLDPNRQETLTLVYATKTGNIKTLMGKIERQPDNTPFIRESNWSTPDSMKSRFFGTWGMKEERSSNV